MPIFTKFISIVLALLMLSQFMSTKIIHSLLVAADLPIFPTRSLPSRRKRRLLPMRSIPRRFASRRRGPYRPGRRQYGSHFRYLHPAC